MNLTKYKKLEVNLINAKKELAETHNNIPAHEKAKRKFKNTTNGIKKERNKLGNNLMKAVSQLKYDHFKNTEKFSSNGFKHILEIYSNNKTNAKRLEHAMKSKAPNYVKEVVVRQVAGNTEKSRKNAIAQLKKMGRLNANYTNVITLQ